jgi:serine/threonine-protein kinase HSL1, negative regulator of Swe1 kinase
MEPFRRPQATSSRRIPLRDAASKANSLPQTTATKMTMNPQLPTFAIENRPFAFDDDENSTANNTSRRPPRPDNLLADVSQVSITAALNPIKSHIGPWQLGKTVGKGGTCKVRQVRHTHTNQDAVAKIITKTTAEKVRARSLANLVHAYERGDYTIAEPCALPISLEREIVIMSLLKHKNIARIYDVWENRDEVYMIMEYVNGEDLFGSLQGSMRGFDEKTTVHVFRQLVEAVVYCHRLQISHRDLKPENIMLDKATFTVKLIDFGMSAFQPIGDALKTPCGSPHYAAPELLTGYPYDGRKADVWSLGVVLHCMLDQGNLPFNYPHGSVGEKQLSGLYEAIRQAKVRLPRHLSREASDLLKRIFVPNPKQRIDIMTVWNHPLLHKYDEALGLRGQTIEQAVGPEPIIEGWKRLTVKDIDPVILKNLLMLWHDSDENTLVTALCNDK